MVVETECRAMGHERCRFTATLAESMPEMVRREESDYAPHHFPEVLENLLSTLKKQKRALRSRERTIERLRSEVERIRPRGSFICDSPALSQTLDTAQAVAPYTTTVLILGESGSGKELMARFVHDQSPRAGKSFSAVNCSALCEKIQEAELFGYARGAFTGASMANAGLFEAAHGGTLFLDEIGDLALTAQTKILRALQEGEVKRLGETRVRKVDTRIVAATNRDLAAMVREKTFREDLYYRLSVVTITLPPLRERANDVLLVAEHFLGVYAKQFHKNVRSFSRAASCALVGYPWPGNIRELENVVQRAVILAKGCRVDAADLPEHLVTGKPAPSLAPAASTPLDAERAELQEIEDQGARLRRALELAGGNRQQAADLLGISRTTLWRRLKAVE